MFEMDLDGLLAALGEMPRGVALGVMFFGSALEYLVPFLPGDTLVVAGAALVTALGWPLWPVFLASTAGSVAGSAVSYGLGVLYRRRERLSAMDGHGQRAIRLLTARFRRHGTAYLAVNRFVPGVRAFFFIAAGIAALPLGPTLFWSAVSAAAWNALLFGLGYLLGDNLEQLEALMLRYQLIVGLLVAVIVVVVVYKAWKATERATEDGAES